MCVCVCVCTETNLSCNECILQNVHHHLCASMGANAYIKAINQEPPIIFMAIMRLWLWHRCNMMYVQTAHTHTHIHLHRQQLAINTHFANINHNLRANAGLANHWQCIKMGRVVLNQIVKSIGVFSRFFYH